MLAQRNCLRSELDYGEFLFILFRKVLGISLTIFTILIVKVRYFTKKKRRVNLVLKGMTYHSRPAILFTPTGKSLLT